MLIDIISIDEVTAIQDMLYVMLVNSSWLVSADGLAV